MKAGVTVVAVVAFGLILILFWLYGERWRIFRRSTFKFYKLGGLRNVLNLKLLKLYVYGRWTKNYIGFQKRKTLPKLRPEKKQAWADKTHFKVLTTENAKGIVSLDVNVSLKSEEQVIPFSTARDIVLNGPPDIVAYECGCRLSSPNPCSPTQVCLVIGQPFTDFVLEHNPRTSRRISRKEALELIESEHQRGHVQTAWFKDICLGRFYALCNCCKCCCIGLQAVNRHGIPMAASSGYVARVDDNLCTVCGNCVESCPFNAVAVDGTAKIDWERCMGCGVCVEQCPEDALTLARDEKKGIPMDIEQMGGGHRPGFA